MMLWVLSFWLVSVSCSAVSLNEEKPDGRIISLSPDVSIRGERYQSEDDVNKQGWVFKGIRYGTAARFQAAVLNTDFSYLNDPSQPKQGYVCPQHIVPMLELPPRNLSMSEDCLYLDIFTPDVPSQQNGKLPVMFWIHGGGFQFGDKDLYDASHLASAINAVVVTVNYRVFAFGFLSTGDDAAKGNYGLSDLKLALKWTQQNIEKFGGDPDAITIFGESAGGAAVSALFLDRNVQESVKTALALSGSILSPWATIKTSKQSVVHLATAVGCPNDTSSADMVECIKLVPFGRILEVTTDEAKKFTMKFSFPPAVDGDHIMENLPAQISGAYQSSKKANFITGFLKEDAALLLLIMSPQLFNSSATLDMSVAKNYVGTYLQTMSPCPQAVLEKVFQAYNFSESDSRDTFIRKLTNFATDASFAAPAIKEAFLYGNRTFSTEVPNQLYRISYDSNFNNLGAFHGMDIMYMFGGQIKKLVNITMNDQVTASLREMLRQVAYEGRITGPNFGTQGAYVDLANSGKFEEGQEDLGPVVKFWDSILNVKC